MPEDEFKTDLRWPTDPLGERYGGAGPVDEVSSREDLEPVTEASTSGERAPVIAGADRSTPSGAEANDRVADRVLERLRVLHEDLEADLAEVRSEMASLRQAVDDLGDRVQLRQLRSSVDDLRSDVAGLRRAVVEGPQEPHAELVASVDRLREELHGRPGVGTAEDPLVSELAAIREELVQLRRRISLRAAVDSPGPDLSEEHLRVIAEAVSTRLRRSLGRGGS